MLLQEKDWDNPGGVIMVEWDYPDQPIKAFIDWMRGNNAWQDNPELFVRKVRQLNGVLMDLRNSGAARPYVPTTHATISAPSHQPEVLVGPEMTRTAIAGTGVESPEEKAARIKAARVAAMAKARAARKPRAGQV